MTLSQGIAFEKYEILALDIDEILKKRLLDLGLTTGGHVKVLTNNNDGTIIVVRGARVVLGKSITESIEVIPVPCKTCEHGKDLGPGHHCHRNRDQLRK